MLNKYVVVILTKTGREIKDSVYLSGRDMEQYITKRTNVFKGLLVSDYFALPLEDISLLFFEGEDVLVKEETK
ncbi:hypothetical protein BUBS_158 [Bacillus phage Bubs]|uniref:Uncharacterized protein n=2 Tax=Wphvirus megatron TaxID=1987728 RepID=A0A1B1PAV8_9CAUD|nr:hypothetical protein QLX47_gp156 [Bacillus phage Eyuki]YP_009285100.1 hypothetical protein BIZ88_gp158 [Bacillus phage DirtyBetty]YP_009287033.1 hypothetical protein BI006_gp157 [Bacillus phage Nemo]ASR78615.1 hypothetical protein BUBS_158 [Bacillus phage Bubs]AXQ67610.1 hypothetical protein OMNIODEOPRIMUS_157 [Bacillus phage OmnioDeoPrimus]ALA46612.1 hypothetical protein EYUKI_156 [Bacillus phage Eyuki]AMW63673.1 hypothetical protein NEMO_157 [Bacillus phage Nemo]ANT41303.1 hypothetical 